MSDTDDLLALLRDSPSVEELRRRLLSAPEELLLKRLALVPEFDEQLMRELSPDGAPSFDEFVGQPFIQPVPGSANRYRLQDYKRASDIELWTQGVVAGSPPPELLEMSRKLAAHFSTAQHRNPVEALRHRLVFEPDAGLRDFEALYDEADARFDLARCQDLIEVLGDRVDLAGAVDLAGTELAAVRDEYRRYLDARGLWIDDYFRTQRFVLPNATNGPIESLLRDGPRALDLFGRGGYGKTMHVRWLIARRCVPAPHRIACARIDFDSIDALAATREPYLVLLEAADQLNLQLPGRPFLELLREYRPHRERLQQRQSASSVRSADSALEGADAGASLGQDIVSRFVAALTARQSTTPVVLVLDTFEEALLLAAPGSDEPATAGLLRMVAEVYEQAQTLRVVFSGRYSVTERLPAVAARFGALARYELQRLQPEEARIYLRERRRIANEELIAAALESSGCVPFNLALIADVIVGEPGISVAEVRQLPADLLYLIERVIGRLPDQPLRWLLRYGAVPRRLDMSFIRDVMLSHLQREMAAGEFDDPTQDPLLDAAGTPSPWSHGDAMLTVEELWQQLLSYAAASSWVSPHPDDADALQLQPEILRPMRRLLGGRDIVSQLHRDAVDYFLARAESESGAPGRWLREAVFHRFQLEGPAAGAWWMEQLRNAERQPAIRRQLAEELVLGRDYLDEHGQPLAWQGSTTIITPETLALARITLAKSNLELAVLDEVPAQHPLFYEAAQSLAQLERGDSASLVPAAQLALVRVGVRLSGTTGEVDAAALSEAEHTLEDARLSVRETAWLRLLYSRRLLEERLPGAQELLQDALVGLEQGSTRAHVLRELIQSNERGGDVAAAIAMLDAATAAGELGTPEDQLYRARLLMSCGDFSAAARAASTIDGIAPHVSSSARLVGAQAALDGWHVEQAAAPLSELRSAGPSASLEVEADRAALAGIAGAACARMLAVGDAQEALGQAVSFGQRASAWSSVADAHLVEAQLMLHELGHLRGAGVALDRADKAAQPGSEPWLRSWLLRAELAARLDGYEASRRLLESVSVVIDVPTAPPQQLALLAVTGLAAGPSDSLHHYALRLSQALQRLTPPAARLLALRGLARCDRQLPAGTAEVLASIGASERWESALGHLQPHDLGILMVALADLQRVAGNRVAAANAIGLARASIERKTGPPVAARELLRVAVRVGDPTLVAATSREAVEAAIVSQDEYPLSLLAAAMIIEAAETGLQRQDAIELIPRLLARDKSLNEAWRARFELVLAGQVSEELEASSRLETAVELYELVGDRLLAAALAARLDDVSWRPVEPDAQVLSLCLEPDGLYVEQQDASDQPVPLNETPVVEQLLGWQAMPARLPYPSGLAALMGEQEWFRAELASLLGHPTSQRDIRLRLRDAALQMVPWELADSEYMPLAKDGLLYRAPWQRALDPRTVQAVQAGLNALPSVAAPLLVDGIAGQVTMAALARAGLPAVGPRSLEDPATVRWLHAWRLQSSGKSVVVAQADRKASERTMRGPRRLGTGAGAHYEAAGYTTSWLESYGERLDEQLAWLMSQEPPPVLLHATGGFAPVAGSVCLDLSGEWGEYTDAPQSSVALITTTQLDRALRSTPGEWPAPVVVLEAVAPGTYHEAASQVLMRNAFAAELFALGSVRAVLATGIAVPEDEARLHEALAGGLAQSLSLGAIVQGIRRTSATAQSAAAHHRLSFATTALWCEDPGIMLP